MSSLKFESDYEPSNLKLNLASMTGLICSPDASGNFVTFGVFTELIGLVPLAGSTSVPIRVITA